MTNHEVTLVGSYDYALVALSVAIAIFASHAALDLARRVTSERGKAQIFWLTGGATAMGFGIWSMHYIGMLAFRLPVSVEYDWPTVLLSLLAAILASAIALIVVSRKTMGWKLAAVASLFMGGGIAAMHYTGMGAMRLPAMCHWSMGLVTLSIALAIVISLVALCLTFYLREEKELWSWRKALSAVVMGAAIPIMHYTGMAAARFTPSPLNPGQLDHAVSVSSLTVAGISTVTFIVLGLVLLTSLRIDSLSDTRQLTIRYFASLGAISLLAILSTLLVQHQSHKQEGDTGLVNIAGRQRMLSQAIAKDALLLARTSDSRERQVIAEGLTGLYEVWQQSHLVLQRSDSSLAGVSKNSPEVQRMLFEIRPHYDAMEEGVRELLKKVQGRDSPADIGAEVQTILNEEGSFLKTMDAIVSEYDREAAGEHDRKGLLHFLLVLSILTALLLQGLVVLRPALGRIQNGISQLESAKQNVQRKATFVQLLQVVAVAANEATSVDAAMQFTIDQICLHTRWPLGHVYFRTHEVGAELSSTDIWYFDDPAKFENFRNATRKTPLAMGQGLPGRVALSGNASWIPDIDLDTNFPRKEAALALGVKGAFGFPVLAQGDVVAVLEFFSNKVEEPDDELLEVMASVGTQLGQVVERKRAGEALRDAETRYRLLVEQLPAVPYIAEPGAVGEWLYVSPQIQTMLGFSAGEWMADRDLWFRQLYAADREAVLDEEKAAEARGDPFQFEYRMFTKDGRLVWIHDACTLVKDAISGRSVQRGVLFDVTERKIAQEELSHKAEELARSNAELEQFAYVASHDLQEPLRMVASYTQLLARRYKGKLDDDAGEFINFAVDGANRMQQLIQDLLSYSRVTTKGKALSPAQAETGCNAAIANLQESIKDANAVVNVAPLPTVLADSTQLTQLFQNLIGNAIKYRNERKPEIHVDARPNGKEWIFSVRDNGIGIEPQYFERIFQMFQRLHTRKEYSGTGIGLAVCRKIVERHGGRIWVESEAGKGSTFLFTIPRTERTEQ